MLKKVFLAALIMYHVPADARLYYVNAAATGSNNGASWQNAYTSLQSALGVAVPDDTIWVAGGIYKPSMHAAATDLSGMPVTDRDKAFVLVNGVRMFGGFDGTETMLGSRDLSLTTNRSILSGDIGAIHDTADNCYHVVIDAGTTAGSNTILDGFTITAGNAAGTGGLRVKGLSIYQESGGGIYSIGSSTAIRNCTFGENNASRSGAGLYNFSAGEISHCSFHDNRAVTYGAGIYNGNSPVISNCNFYNNVSNGGAGIYNSSSASLVDSCTFTNNRADVGAGMANSNSTVSVVNCVFNQNTATTSGGGMFNTGSARPVISNCKFLGNTAANQGGGICNLSNSQPVIRSCVFSRNTSNIGGGVHSFNGSITITNTVFTGNTANSAGGGASIQSNSSAISHCTFYNNRASNTNARGGGLYYSSAAGGTMTNSILYNNLTPGNTANANREEIFKLDATGVLTVSNCIVRDATGHPLAIAGTTVSNCSTEDPMLSRPAVPAGVDSVWATADDGLALRGCSPAIGMGVPIVDIATDLTGAIRSSTAPAAGAYEYAGSYMTPQLAAAGTSYTADQMGTTTFGDCNGIIATVTSGQTNGISGTTTAIVYAPPATPVYNSQPYVPRYFNISPVSNANTARAIITLYFSQADFNSYNASRGSYPSLPVDSADAANHKANLRITQQHGTSATGAPGSYSGWAGSGPANVLITPSSVVYNTKAARWEVTFPVTGFSGFFVHTGLATPLPVRLVSFTAQPEGSANKLIWQATAETAGSAFTITRSANGRDFTTIGTLPASGRQAGYRFMDDAPLTPVSYYRLIVEESNGGQTYSNIAVVRSSNYRGYRVSVAPVPATTAITIANTDATLDGSVALITDMHGKTVHAFSLQPVNHIVTRQWPAGIYSLKLINGEVIRIVKQ